MKPLLWDDAVLEYSGANGSTAYESLDVNKIIVLRIRYNVFRYSIKENLWKVNISLQSDEICKNVSSLESGKEFCESFRKDFWKNIHEAIGEKIND